MNRLNQRNQPGFTLIEVMIAIGIMTVGSLGILSMHHAVSGANRSTQEMSTALAITERWVERVERDSLAWSAEGLNTGVLTGTDYLSPLAGTVSSTGWFTPIASAGFDYFGDDTNAVANIKYCTNLRLSWLRQGISARVDIRTFWYRAGYVAGNATHPNWVDGSDFRAAACDAGTAEGWNLGAAPNVDVVVASTVVTWLRRN
jgi:prepilin-type N-terminal cleavage/methylation domain-containing protein